MSVQEADALGKLLFKPGGGLSPDVVGKSAAHLAKLAGFSVPTGTQILVARAKISLLHGKALPRAGTVCGA